MVRSRLQRLEEKRDIRRAFLLVIATLCLIVVAVVAGIPLLTRLALFFSGLNSAASPIAKTDNIPPPPPRLDLAYTATNSAQQVLSGIAEPGTTVYLTQNDQTFGSVVTSDEGVFHFSNVLLLSGMNNFSAVAMDQAGNTSLSSDQGSMYYSKDPPPLTITSPTDRQVITGANAVEIKGTTKGGHRVTVNDRNIIVSSSGNFTTSYSLNSGDNVLVFIVTDSAGNQTRKELTVTYNQ